MANERSQFIKRILDAEGQYPVESWKIDDIHVWPLIRIQLFFSWFNAQKHSSQPATMAKTAKSGYLRFIWQGILSYIRLKQLSVPVTKFLFSGAYTHRIKIRDFLYNRYFDPLIDKIGEGVLLEYQRLDDRNTKYSHRKSVVELEDYLPWFQLKYAVKNALFKEKPVVHLPEYGNFLEQFNDVINNNVQSAGLCRLVLQIKMHAEIYEYFIKRTKAKYVFGLCFYNVPMYGMNLAARRLGAVSVDMQHGTQGKSHIAYTNWSRLPARGYELLPRWFWVWDESSYNLIKEWSGQLQHKVYQGGNPGLILKELEYPYQLFHGKPIILYTLQPLGQAIEPYIIETIRLTFNEYDWWLRFHPRHAETEKEEIRKLLENNGLIHEVNMRESNELPLPVILNNTAVHLSRFSGSVIEGVQMGVPTIVIDQTGAETFWELVEADAVKTCINANPEELNGLIRKITGTKANKSGAAGASFSLRESLENFIQLTDAVQ
ncbi:hypothetical protein EDD80_11740 [Anseongella ginsenosidimutans]|uniref:Uncharacterized protein n=1 Tax=Anseongella ginsenosidimutans TaxID=496056 RepID=A0A4R3KLV4_9SPHI|nr:hypothetical protein [Anseongella ginsenosidimutans]QEC52110.1 hypothetical protein FRZ59_07030 [Anseongella ginsenosidimutans]TCS84862.1 hypothetical protein EDD80_11740 [Anseongella ginsenosidimutans]